MKAPLLTAWPDRVSKKPNIVLIFTDNQQAETLGCYGNSEVHTPHLDRLSAEGMTFDNAFCPNAFCSPCRASVLTGQLPSQHGVHSWLDDRGTAPWPKGWHALDGMQTLPKCLKAGGYSTALIGKYHLGESTTPAEGFDHWVTLEDGHVRSFYNNTIFDNGSSYAQTGHSVDFFTGKAMDFIADQANAEDPFFLFLTYPAPYGHWPATKEDIACRHTDRYADCPMTTIPREGLSKEAVDGFVRAQARSSKDLDLSMLMRAPNDLATLRNYYAQISMVDDGVGQVIAALEQHGVAEDTLVVFTTDHGLSLGHHGFWGHGAACFPSNLHRAAHSVPMIVRHRGVTAEGVRSSLMVSNMDLFSTILSYADVPLSDPEAALASRDFAPLLRGQPLVDWGDDVVFAEQEETRVVRTPDWAYFKRFDGNESEPLTDALFDLKADPAETTNLSGDTAYSKVEHRLRDMVQKYFESHAQARADLWAGGVPLQNSVRIPFWREVWGQDWAPVFQYETP
jgi:arylsulfatase A-like enzyme